MAEVRRLDVIAPMITSHGVGSKRVLLSALESGCGITQIAITELKAGEVASAHIHQDMQEYFFVLDGEIEIFVDGDYHQCNLNDFVIVNHYERHEVKAITNARFMTIGCITNNIK